VLLALAQRSRGRAFLEGASVAVPRPGGVSGARDRDVKGKRAVDRVSGGKHPRRGRRGPGERLMRFFVFDTLPGAFNNGVVALGTLPIHAELDAVLLDHVQKRPCR
jgi:hypothetical protein